MKFQKTITLNDQMIEDLMNGRMTMQRGQWVQLPWLSKPSRFVSAKPGHINLIHHGGHWGSGKFRWHQFLACCKTARLDEQRKAERRADLMARLHNARHAMGLARDMMHANARGIRGGFNGMKAVMLNAIRREMARANIKCMKLCHRLKDGFDYATAIEAENHLDHLQSLLQVVPV